jgi:hypothetical protein
VSVEVEQMDENLLIDHLQETKKAVGNDVEIIEMIQG